jgi:signal transduction histidine kinase
MTLRRLQVYALLGLALLIALLEAARHAIGGSGRSQLVAEGLVVLGALVFFSVLFRYFARLQGELVQRNRELLTLHSAALDVHRVLDLELLLQRVVDEARDLLGARFGALSVVDSQGTIEAFHTSGISAEERDRIGHPPSGKGLLGVVLREGQVLRLARLADDRRSAGFPANHPAMTSLLAVPVECRGPFRGNLYLSDRLDGAVFTEADVETLQRFATQVAIAIDNQYLHRRLRDLAVAEERARIARDLHDGTAQVLAYVNAKAQAVREYLVGGQREEAARQLEQLATAARDVYAEVREGIVTLREAVRQERSLAEELRGLVETWRAETGVPVELRLDGEVWLDPEAEVQLLRVAGEALANIRKHARPQTVRVDLDAADGRVRLSVEDDGAGFEPHALPPADLPRFGLKTMRERAESLGGTFRITTRLGGPTRVAVELPRRAGRRPEGGGAS